GVGPAAFVTDATGRHQPGQSHEQRQESDRVAGAVAGHDAPWDQPFTAPAVRPRTMCRWNSTRTMTMGTAAMTAPATGMFDCSMRVVSPRSAIWIVPQLSVSVMTARGHRYWLNAPMNEMTVNDAITGRVRGTAKRNRNCRWLHPSRR